MLSFWVTTRNQLSTLSYDLFKVIPQYCTAHPVLRIITRKNIMAAFLAGKLAREKMGVWKDMVGKKRRKFGAKKEKTAQQKC